MQTKQKQEDGPWKILTMATDTGQTVMDCYLGSGTTAAVCHNLGCRNVELFELSVVFSDALALLMALVT